MLFALTITYSAENRDAIVQRFAAVAGEDELPAGVRLVGRYHSPATRWGCVIFETSSVTPIHLWCAKYNDLCDAEIHPVETDDLSLIHI